MSSLVRSAPGRIRTYDPRFRKPQTENAKPLSEQGLTNSDNNALSQISASAGPDDAELRGLVEALRRLPEHVRKTISELIKMGGE